MAARGKKFSWMRLINNAVPNFANDSPNDVDLSPGQADQLVAHQLSLPWPLYLDPLSFFHAQITTSKTVSASVHRALLKHDIITSPPATGNITSSKRTISTASTSTSASAASTNDNNDSSTNLSRWQSQAPTVLTSGITRHFANHLSMISVHAQRKLVALLFFWEEECTRWKLLEQEEDEILKAMLVLERELNEGNSEDQGEEEVAAGAMLGDGTAMALSAEMSAEVSADSSQRNHILAERKRFLIMARRAVQMRRGLLPSQRAEATVNVADGVGYELPAYD